MVSEKFGTEKSLEPVSVKFGSGKKVSEPVSEKFGTEKSTSIGIENIWYWKKVSVSVNILGTVTHCWQVAGRLLSVAATTSPLMPLFKKRR